MSGVSFLHAPDAADVVVTGALAYSTNNFQDGDPLYVGKTSADGVWLIERFSSVSGEKSYANLSNNPTQTSGYAPAWAQRASLVYAQFHDLTGV